jgi:lipoate---protein ligase
MIEHWRLLTHGSNTASTNMAIDRAILEAHKQNLVPPTIRFYSWSPPAVSIGYFQSLTAEVDLEACKRYGVDVVRRITGGGAVYHDKELTYSIVIAEKHPAIPLNIIQSYERICNALVRSFDHLGIKSTFAPINDIVVNGKKISGNAQTRKDGVVLQHGTILLDVDVETMFSLLKIPNEKLKDKLITDAKQRVTSLHQVLGRNILFDEVASALACGFQDEFQIALSPGSLTTSEQHDTRRYKHEYFTQPQWNHRR